MKIAGIVKSSFIDYPGRASAVLFLPGCNFRCGYCHNPDIVHSSISSEEGITIPDLIAFLEKRKRFLDAVCISGGEPTQFEELYVLAESINDMGYLVKLDTNGTNPALLSRMLSSDLLDYVAMDIKGPWDRYPEITGRKGLEAAVQESAKLLLEWAERRQGELCYEFRTTVCREQLTEEDLRRMVAQLPGGVRWFLQSVRDSGKQLAKSERYSPYTKEEMEALGKELCVSVR